MLEVSHDNDETAGEVGASVADVKVDAGEPPELLAPSPRFA